MSQSCSTQQEKEELQRRIRGLTTVLHTFAVQKGPSRQPPDTHHYLLRFLTTLLTCDEECDTGANRVIAVTTSIDPEQRIRILIAAQDPHAPSIAPPTFLKPVQQRHRSLDEVVAGYYSLGFEWITIC